MPKYKNCSGSTYKFYGVTFDPGDVKYVGGPISHPKFIIVPDADDEQKQTEKPQTATTTSTTQTTTTTTESDEPKKRKSKGE